MSTTAQTVFELTMHLIDEQDPQTGQADTGDTAAYKARTLALLNLLQWECQADSDSWEAGEEGKRPRVEAVTDFTTPLALDDGICRGVLPYGLAAHLLLEENPAAASFFHACYQERRAAARREVPRNFEAIEDVYGGLGFGAAGRW